ncbi:TPA: hypothetical protein QDB15_006001 [Burkholderia vietnamiensis]|uniref:MarR family transcriptional regulator n=1 Tax=Burkholderia vietnamiensis TaxID=60552 RepID=UPI0015930C80|nr:MarR family transcriptional regulator [Burkholderia vietnamiensis]MCA8207136.1 MarR family transcriptional regulator [Burkholderia vietnamiensis]HDR9101144.1 hypothetical protein [Burkholderia vietnamiensis]HDR9122130.1 hypothetical protein [Burkholderia vietnamiensis]HDR9167962.1 hypothetical protein [Burkholderia vietnamiensis]HDR9281526.1 hypothetical protein [Burkholderia vietnamiensis]
MNDSKKMAFTEMNLAAAWKRASAQRYISEAHVRDTKRKRAILQMLEEHGEREYLEYGPPPYNATTIADEIGGSAQSVARTLRGMAKDGLLVAVRDRQDVWNAIAGGHIEMPVTAYFSARTVERDRAAAQAWRDGAAERSEVALRQILAPMAH